MPFFSQCSVENKLGASSVIGNVSHAIKTSRDLKSGSTPAVRPPTGANRSHTVVHRQSDHPQVQTEVTLLYTHHCKRTMTCCSTDKEIRVVLLVLTERSYLQAFELMIDRIEKTIGSIRAPVTFRVFATLSFVFGKTSTNKQRPSWYQTNSSSRTTS